MTKSAESKSSARQQQNTANQSFFNQGEQETFFSQESPFFQNHSIQFKPLGTQKPFFSPSLQRTPAFESDGAIQAKATPNPKAIASPSQSNPDEKQVNPEEETSTDFSEIQLMPAFSSADDSGEQPPSSLQFRLMMGQAGDAYEQEADQMAHQVMNMAETQSKPLAKGITPRLQQSNSTPGNSVASSELESQLNSSQGQGSPLSDNVRSFMEPRFGADFSQVRTHTDSSAVQMNQGLQAKAFTHGNDIYFGEGQSPGNNELTAHELTHTVQQGASNKSLQKDALAIQKVDDPESNPNIFESPTGKGKVERTGDTFKLIVEKIKLPDFKVSLTKYSPIKLPKETRENKQVQDWEGQFSQSSAVEQKIDDKIKDAPRPINNDTNTKIYAFKFKKDDKNFLIGDKQQIKKKIIRPQWTSDGKPANIHVDHGHEHQIGGPDREGDNLWLLEGRINVQSGNKIKKEKYSRIQDLIDEAHSIGGFWTEDKPKAQEKRHSSKFSFEFKDKEPGLDGFEDYDETKSYTKEEIEQGKSLKGLEPLTSQEIEEIGLNNDNFIWLFTEASGGNLHKIRKSPRTGSTQDIHLKIGVNLRIRKIDVKYGSEGEIAEGSELEVEVFSTRKSRKILGFLKTESGTNERHTVPLKPMNGLLNAAYIDASGLVTQFNKVFKAKGMSPINFEEVELDDINGISAKGKILPSIPIIRDTEIDLVIVGNDIYIEKVFSGPEFAIPSPFRIDDSSLAVRAGSRGLEFSGSLDFSIEKLGNGSITAFLNTRKEFGLRGQFNFDSTKFNPASIAIEYSEKEGFKINGKIGIKEGTIPGVKDAKLEANYAQNQLSLAGLAHLTVPGIDEINLAAQFDDQGNFAFTAEVDLKAMKGIKGGKVKVTISSQQNEEDINLRVEGKASPDFPSVPNLNTELSVLYDNGIFKVETTVNYRKGRFNGTIQVGVTNQTVDEKGRPQGEPTEEGEVFVFGFGQLTVDLFKGNTGTIGVRLTPEKEVLIAGEIRLSNLSPFGDGVNYHKELLSLPELEIPLIGIPGMSVSAFISGGVHFKFDWQPLMLKILVVKFEETNINELESIQLDITGSVGSMASAEVYIAIDAGLRARVLIATLSGSLGGEAGLGVTAEAGGDLEATWDMEKGLQLKQIIAHLDVTPKAIFRLTGTVSVDLDLWLTSVNLYYHRWVFAEQEIDMSGLTLKADFPIRFDDNGDLIKPSIDEISLEKPNFTGSQGRDILNQAINSEAEKKLAAKKEEIRGTIKRDLRDPENELTPTEYTKKMTKKYKDSPELKAFVIQAIEDESRLLEYEKFEEQKTFIRQMDGSLEKKFRLLSLFSFFYQYVRDSDIEAFKAELIKIEEDKKLQTELANQET
ncbi:MAG: DUF4157 domain-containing protein [Crocosphaera sp.]|nr:DUF4157 domain-containing protein [Crocosphaera sp.]